MINNLLLVGGSGRKEGRKVWGGTSCMRAYSGLRVNSCAHDASDVVKPHPRRSKYSKAYVLWKYIVGRPLRIMNCTEGKKQIGQY